MNLFGVDIPILSILIFLPLAGAVATALVPRADAHRMALAVSVLNLLLSLLVVGSFQPVADYQFVERVNWISAFVNEQTGQPQFLMQYFVGVDGLSLWLVPLITLLTALSIWFSSDSIRERENEFYAYMLVLSTGMMGVFLALDLFLFFVFWEAVLIPMYFLIGVWGGSNRRYATIKFILYTMAASSFMLAAIVALGIFQFTQTGAISFALTDLQATVPFLEGTARLLMFLAFAGAFAVKVPLFPFHTWLPDAHVQAPTAGSVILAGILLKMGTYGYMRFALPLFPTVARDLAPVFAILAIIGILYGAWVAYAQRDIKSLVAYSSVSHLGFVMLGIFSLNSQGFNGAAIQMINHGVSTGALFLLVGMIYERRHTRGMDDFGGLWKVMPVYAGFFLITMLSSVGLPGLNGFVGEFLTLLGAFQANPVWAIFATFGVVLAAVYLLHLFGKLFFGPLDVPENFNLPDLTRKEIGVLIPLVLLMILIGVAPNLFLDPMQPSLNALADTIQNASAAGLVP